jgi:hypothetical protein
MNEEDFGDETADANDDNNNNNDEESKFSKGKSHFVIICE